MCKHHDGNISLRTMLHQLRNRCCPYSTCLLGTRSYRTHEYFLSQQNRIHWRPMDIHCQYNLTVSPSTTVYYLTYFLISVHQNPNLTKTYNVRLPTTAPAPTPPCFSPTNPPAPTAQAKPYKISAPPVTHKSRIPKEPLQNCPNPHT